MINAIPVGQGPSQRRGKLKQRLPASIPVILYLQSPAGALIRRRRRTAYGIKSSRDYRRRVLITEPTEILHTKTFNPLVLHLGKGLNPEVDSKVLAISVAAPPIIALTKTTHTQVELRSASTQIKLIPCERKAVTKTARVKAVVSGQQVILGLSSKVARALPV